MSNERIAENSNQIIADFGNKVKNFGEQFNTISIQVSNEIELKNALLNIRSGGLIQLKNDIEITKQININKYIIFDGCGFELKCVTNGLHEWFKVSSIGKITIKNSKFNDNLKGRVILATENVEKINLINCEFTGYSKEFGYYQTDGLVRIDGGCKDILIDYCDFVESGYNYTTQLEELNRCITFNDTLIENATVRDSKFYKVNQAIVSIAKNLTVDNCKFDSVKDNFIYCLGDTLTAINNKFINCQDEVIVTSTKTNFISSNYFKDFSNKAIAINGDLTLLDVKNNTFINTFDSGQVLSFRGTPTSKVINFLSNTCILSETLYSNSYAIVNTNRCEVFNCDLNFIETNQPNASNIITTAGNIINFNKNNFNNINGATNCIALNSTIPTSVRNIGNDNIIKGMRLILAGNNVGSKIETNSQYYTNDRCNILFADSKPLYILPQGTIVFNSNYTSMLSSAIAWISNGNEWVEQKVFKPFVHEKSNTPINWSEPRFIGDIWVGNEGSIWIGINTDGATSSSWKKLLD